MVLAVTPVVAAACGSDGSSSGTLPPIGTTTSTSTTLATTTTLQEFYTIQSGDTISKIASRFGVSRSDLMALNGITNADHIEKGARLKIPRPGDVIPSTLPATTSSGPDGATTVAP